MAETVLTRMPVAAVKASKNGWMSFASTSYFEISRVLDTRTAALDQAHDAYRDLLNQMANHQLAVMAITVLLLIDLSRVRQGRSLLISQEAPSA